MHRARKALLANWREAVVIAALYEIASIIRGRALDLSTLAILSWALVGLALARRIPRFEPLPVLRAIADRARPLRAVALMIVIAVVATFVSRIAGGLGMSLGHALTGEVSR